MTAKQEGFVKGKSPAVEQDALVTPSMGMQARMAPKPEASGDVAVDQGSVDAIREAIAAKDEAQVASLLSSASKAVLDEIGRDSSLIESLQDLPEAERNAAYDYLHLSITDADLLVDIIYQRFGVMLLGKNQHKKDAKNHLKQKRKSNVWAESVSDNDVDFSAAHAQQIYSGYMCLPQSALDKIVFVFSETNNVDGLGYDQGYAMTPLNNICLNSQAGQEDERNAVNTGMGGMGGMFAQAGGTGNVSSNKDAAFNTVFRQWTAIHEVGHVIDSEGGSYSESADFRACSGWNEFNSAENVVNQELLKDENVESPYLDDFTEEEKEVANKIAIELAKTNDKDAAQKIAKKNKSKLTNYSLEQINELIEDSHESWSNEGGMNLFKAASLTQKDEVWYEMKGYKWMADHMKRPTHYHKTAWWSYDRDTREAGKISAYQYAFPKEDFAEAYACYYYQEILDQKAKTGNQMPAKLKAWFDAHKKELES